MADAKAIIEEKIKSAPIVLFMKGSTMLPQCGFSASAVECLKRAGAEEIVSVDILQDPDIRAGVKEFTGWPTIPQAFIGGEFIGGSDILREMLDKGELETKVKSALAS